jgi:Flp pilus assembly protein TadD
VLLRLGRFDEAIDQFDGALQVQPKDAWSLYGRGLAKLKKGATAQGQADIASAIVVQPNIVRETKSYGLAPDGATTVTQP